jgi:hypothetical protein
MIRYTSIDIELESNDCGYTIVRTDVIKDGRAHSSVGIRCHACGTTSYHPVDVEQRYCGFCHRFHEEPSGLGAPRAPNAPSPIRSSRR